MRSAEKLSSARLVRSIPNNLLHAGLSPDFPFIVLPFKASAKSADLALANRRLSIGIMI